MEDEEVFLPDYQKMAFETTKLLAERWQRTAETRWSYIERAAAGWHFVMISELTEERGREMIEWATENVKGGCHLHLETDFGPDANGVALFENKVYAALFKTMFCHG